MVLNSSDVNAQINLIRGDDSGIASVTELNNAINDLKGAPADIAKETVRLIDAFEKLNPDKLHIAELQSRFKETAKGVSELGSEVDKVKPRGLDALNAALIKAKGGVTGTRKETVSLASEIAALQRQRAPTELAKQFAQLAAQAGTPRTALLQLQAELTKIDDISNTEVRRAAETFDRELSRQIQAATRDAERLNKELERPINISNKNFRDIRNTLRGIGGTVGGAPGALLGAGADITQLVDDVGDFREAISKAGEAAAKSSGLLGNIATAAATAVPGLTAAGAGIVAIAAVALPFATAIAAVGAVIAIANNHLEEARKRGEAYAQMLVKQIDAQIDAQKAFEKGGGAGLQDSFDAALDELDTATRRHETLVNRRAELERQLADREVEDRSAAREALASLKTEIEDSAKAVEDANVKFAAVGDVYFDTGVQAEIAAEKTKEAEEERAAIIAEKSREINQLVNSGLTTEGLQQRIADVKAQLEAEKLIRYELAQTVGTQNEAFEQSITKTEELNSTLEALENETVKAAAASNTYKRQLEENRKALEDATKALVDYNERLAEINAKRALQDADRAEDAANKAADKAEDLARHLEDLQQQHAQRMADIVAKGNEKIQQLQQALADKITETNTKIAEITQQYNDQQLKAEQKFTKESLRRQRDFELARKRLEEDFANARFDALLSGDLSNVLRVQRDEAQKLARQAEDFQISSDDRREDFEAEKAERAEALRIKIEEIQLELSKYQEMTALKIAEVEKQTAQELASAQKTYEDRLAKDAETRAILAEREERDSRIRQDRMIRDRLIEDAQAAAALQRNLRDIASKADAETAAIIRVTGVVATLDTAIAITAFKARQLIAELAKLSSGSTSPRPSSTNVIPFDNGGIIKQPTLGLLHKDEVVIPLNKLNDLLKLNGNGGGSPIFNTAINLSLSGTVSPQDVQKVKTEIETTVKDTMKQAFTTYATRTA